MGTNTTKITTEIITENATKIIKSFQFKLGDHPVYVESNGQVVDEITARPYLQSHSVFVPWKPYYWFNLEFDSYIYKSIYNVCTDSFQKMAYKKVYYLIEFGISNMYLENYEYLNNHNFLLKQLAIYLNINNI